MICWLDRDGKIWSDGYNSHDIAHEYPLITRCDECYGYFWVSSVSRFNQKDHHLISFAIHKQIHPGKNKYKPIRKLVPEEYADVLALKRYRDLEEERYLRTHLWWTINDPLRSGIQEDIAPELKELFEENLEALIYKTPLNGAESQLTLAEIHRELGLFRQAEKHLDKVADRKYEQFLLKMRQRIEINDRRIFLV
ncbi:MAG: hypothetical protein HGA23_03970 [Bacteroidales bacterium]|nr:hypothetical protein [Bacteroidales bacterium]